MCQDDVRLTVEAKRDSTICAVTSARATDRKYRVVPVQILMTHAEPALFVHLQAVIQKGVGGFVARQVLVE